MKSLPLGARYQWIVTVWKQGRPAEERLCESMVDAEDQQKKLLVAGRKATYCCRVAKF